MIHPTALDVGHMSIAYEKGQWRKMTSHSQRYQTGTHCSTNHAVNKKGLDVTGNLEKNDFKFKQPRWCCRYSRHLVTPAVVQVVSSALCRGISQHIPRMGADTWYFEVSRRMQQNERLLLSSPRNKAEIILNVLAVYQRQPFSHIMGGLVQNGGDDNHQYCVHTNRRVKTSVENMSPYRSYVQGRE